MTNFAINEIPQKTSLIKEDCKKFYDIAFKRIKELNEKY